MTQPTGLMLVAAALAAACGSGAPAERGSRPGSAAAGAREAIAGPRRGEYAVVSHGADFYLAPRENAVHFRAQKEPRTTDATEDFATGVVLRVLGARDGWVEVENPGDEEVEAQHCREALGGLYPFRLHFFVREDALGLVVARRVSQKYPDGTSVDLMPGLPLGRAAPARRHTSRREFGALRLELAAGSVGRSYAPATADVAKRFRTAAKAAEEDSGEGKDILTGDATLHAGPHEIVTGKPAYATARRVAGGLLVDLVDPCAAITALARADDVGMFGIGGVGGRLTDQIEGYVTDHDSRYLYPGVALFWEDGSPAGEARTARRYDYWRRHPTRQELACIVHDLLRPGSTMAPNAPEARDRPRVPTEITICFRYDDTKYRWEE
ncbi:MAG TPA: hypothetical protein VIG06_05170 [Kofleriaceae bacterium]